MKNDPIRNMMTLFCRAHPWHGIDIGENAPELIHCYIEIVPTDTVKFELDKGSGILKVDRPQKYSNRCPTLYGLIPQTHAGQRVGDFCGAKTNRKGIKGDDDPLDICVLTERHIDHGDILVSAIPIGGIRAIDGEEADDKIIAILKDDLVYKDIRDIHECPANLIDRLRHYFLTYKDLPGNESGGKKRMEITHIYDKNEALEIIRLAQQDYDEHFQGIRTFLNMP